MWYTNVLIERCFMSHYTIYALIDPRDNQIRYIGITKKNLKSRLNNHYYKDARDNLAKRTWLNELTDLGMKALIEEIETVTEEQACFSEEFWIAHYRSIGVNLLNMTNGGYGVPGLKFTQAVRNRMSNALKGKKKPIGFGEKVAVANRKRILTEETKQKISKSNKDFWQSQEGKILSSKIRKGRIISKEWADKIGESNKKSWSPEKRKLQKDKNGLAGAKLTWELVREIRANTTNSIPELALQYNVHVETIRHIKKNLNWKE